MTFNEYKVAFTTKAEASGFSYEIINKCLAYAQVLFSRNLPLIYDITHLAKLVGYKKDYIERAIVFTNFFYRYFNIGKKNGELRRISEPLPSLKDIQTWILGNILYHVECSKYAKAYIPQSTIKQNLVFHKNQIAVLKLDIENFFSSITEPRVESLFNNLGYSKSISNLLAKLCTLNQKLPQGAPTSPYISNLILKDFDNTIGKYCLDHKIRYTRYSDDLTFSGAFESAEITKIVTQELGNLSMKVNDKKTKLMKVGMRQIVTGIVVNEKLQVERSKRKKVRQEMYYLKKFGLSDHLAKINCQKNNYLSHLLGKVQFILHINPTDLEFQQYKMELKKMLLIDK